jgi:hypothetical protein
MIHRSSFVRAYVIGRMMAFGMRPARQNAFGERIVLDKTLPFGHNKGKPYYGCFRRIQR